VKLWLLEILACPIDHAYPLELTVFRWQDEDSKVDQIAELMQNIETGKEILPKADSPLKTEIQESRLLIKDYLIIKPTPIEQYLQMLLEKIKELSVVSDKSTWTGENALAYIKKTIKPQLEKVVEQLQKNNALQPEMIEKEILPKIQSALEF